MTTDAAKPKLGVRRLAVWGLTLAAFGFVVYVVPIRDRCTEAGCEPGLASALGRANLPLLIALFVVYLLGSLAWAARWRELLRIADVDVSLGQVWRVTLEAQAGGILLPGGVAGDALRIGFVHARAKTKDGEGAREGTLAKIVASVFVDRLLGLATLAGLAAAASLSFGAGGASGGYFRAVLAIPVACGLGWLLLRRLAQQRPAWLENGRVGRLARPLLAYVGAEGGPAALFRGTIASLAVSGVQLVVIRGLVAALGATPSSEAWVYVGTTLGMIVGALPLAPGSWGTADAAYAFFLGQAGVAASVAVSVCMIYRLYWYATGIIGALLALAGRARGARNPRS